MHTKLKLKEKRSPMEYRAQKNFDFGGLKVYKEQIVFQTRHSNVFVNIKPFLPGHLLVCPRRRVERVSEMTDEEFLDFSDCIKALIEGYKGEYEYFTVGIQDGVAAGQTVFHVHAHFIPRRDTLPCRERKELKLEEMKEEAEKHFEAVFLAVKNVFNELNSTN